MPGRARSDLAGAPELQLHVAASQRRAALGLRLAARQRLTRRDQRILARVGRQLDEIIEVAADLMRGAVERRDRKAGRVWAARRQEGGLNIARQVQLLFQ